MHTKSGSHTIHTHTMMKTKSSSSSRYRALMAIMLSTSLALLTCLALSVVGVTGASIPAPGSANGSPAAATMTVGSDQVARSEIEHQHHNQKHHHHHHNHHHHHHHQKQQELHFGAKIALSLLMAVILLVASATFVDLNSTGNVSSRSGSCCGISIGSDSGAGSGVAGSSIKRNLGAHFHSHLLQTPTQKQQSHNNQQQQQHQLSTAQLAAPTTLTNYQNQPLGQRDQRSPSLSSSSSSTLFNSISSASAPILAASHRWRKHQFSHHHHLDHDDHDDVGGGLRSRKRHLLPDGRKQLAQQVFLSFSLRHSASLIFESTTSTSRREYSAPGKAANDGQRHNSCQLDSTGQRVAPRSSSRRKQLQSSPIESIDSLHGLRFLSMIWIIVIHSYSFALRWLFFTNSPTLENIYKTAASQLLANGTFACDSFFFAGGFLLPYLAFPAYKSASTSAETCRQDDEAAAVAAAQSSVQAATACTTTSSASKQCKQDNSSYRNHHRQHRARSSSPGSRAGSSHCGGGGGDGNCSQAESDSLSSASGSLDSRQSAHACLSCNHLAPHHHHHHHHHQHQQLNHHQPLDENQNHENIASHTCWHHHHQQQQLAPTEITTSHDNKNINQENPQSEQLHTNEFTLTRVIGNILHRYIRMMPLMMAIIGLSATLLRYLGEGPAWEDSTMMFDKWCRQNWWINALFLHNFVKRENMCLSHSWYSAVDIQLFLLGQVILFTLFRSKKLGILMCCIFLFGAQLITGALTLIHHLPAVPLIASVSEQSLNLYYGEIYIKPYCRASPYLIGILLAYLMRTSSLGQLRLNKWQVATGWTLCIGTLVAILMAMQPAMNGQVPSELQSALYSSLSRPLWACATGWMIFACMTKHGGIFATILSARCFVPLSRLTYPAFLIHPIVMAVFYGSRQASFHFSHYLMLYLILGNIVITYAIAFLLSALFELPLLSIERAIKRAWCTNHHHQVTSNRTSGRQTLKPPPPPPTTTQIN